MKKLTGKKLLVAFVLILVLHLFVQAIDSNSEQDVASIDEQRVASATDSYLPTEQEQKTISQLIECADLLRPFWEEFVSFRYTDTFDFYGFGRGGPHYQWLESIQDARGGVDEVCRVYPAELEEKGLVPKGLDYPFTAGGIVVIALDAIRPPLRDYLIISSKHLDRYLAWADEAKQ